MHDALPISTCIGYAREDKNPYIQKVLATERAGETEAAAAVEAQQEKSSVER